MPVTQPVGKALGSTASRSSRPGSAWTRAREEVAPLPADFPARWHSEEFFRFDQHLGWIE
jgi:hypothetical protein